jgi:hypothetical protein
MSNTSPPDHDELPDHAADDAALSWGDENDATYVDAPDNPIRVRAARERDPDAPAGSGALVGMGVFGGIYLLYTVAWLISGSTFSVAVGTTTATVFLELLRVLAIMAPALWFAATVWLASARSTRTRFIWLVIGVIVLVPWPFIMTRSF